MNFSNTATLASINLLSIPQAGNQKKALGFPFPLALDTVALADSLNNLSNCHGSECWEIPATSTPLLPSYIYVHEKESTEVVHSSTVVPTAEPICLQPSFLLECTSLLEASKKQPPDSNQRLAGHEATSIPAKESSSPLEEAIRRPSLKWNPQGTGLISNGGIKRKTKAKPYDKRTLVFTISTKATNN